MEAQRDNVFTMCQRRFLIESMTMFNKKSVINELFDYISETENALDERKPQKDLKKQWQLEIALARIAIIILKGIECE